MCIIAVKPRFIKNPSKEILRNMFCANPDGAGVAYNLNGKLHIVKGLMNFESFWEVCKNIPQESAAIYHARIETSGGVCKELTHPFLLDKDIDKQRQLKIEISKGEAVAHNGVFSEFKWKENNNDTTQFIATYLSPLKTIKDQVNKSILDNDLKDIINKLCGSSNKLAIINEQGNVMRYGERWILDNGIYYSNSTYEEKIYKYYNPFDSIETRRQINNLRKSDPDFEMAYQSWREYMLDSEILECYEKDWI